MGALDAADFKGSTGQLLELLAGAKPWCSHPSDRAESDSHAQRIEWEAVRPWPTLEPAALQGLAGDVVRTLEPHTEADPAAVLLTFLVAFGNALGDRPHARVGGARHPARLFACIVGETARARKGQSLADVRVILEAADPEWWNAAKESGLASGEGIVKRFADRDDGTPVEKRALFLEAEFARTLVAAGRETSTLSHLIRDAWDTGELRVLTRKDPLRATGAHAGVVAHITLEELRARLVSAEIGSGFANRFLFTCARRSKKLPAGGNLSAVDLDALTAKVRDALATGRKRDAISRTPDAERRWAELYNTLPEPPGLLGAITARAEAQLLRLSLVYALLDGAHAIDVPHLLAALAVWRYAEASAAHIFGGVLGSDTADRLLVELRAVYPDGLDREAQSALFHRNRAEAELEAARRQLEARGLAQRRSVPSDTGKGRPREVLCAVPPATKEPKETKKEAPAGSREAIPSSTSFPSSPDGNDWAEVEP